MWSLFVRYQRAWWLRLAINWHKHEQNHFDTWWECSARYIPVEPPSYESRNTFPSYDRAARRSRDISLPRNLQDGARRQLAVQHTRWDPCGEHGAYPTWRQLVEWYLTNHVLETFDWWFIWHRARSGNVLHWLTIHPFRWLSEQLADHLVDYGTHSLTIVWGCCWRWSRGRGREWGIGDGTIWNKFIRRY